MNWLFALLHVIALLHIINTSFISAITMDSNTISLQIQTVSPDTILTRTTTQLTQPLCFSFKPPVRITFTQRPKSTRYWTNQMERKEPLSFTSWWSADALDDPSAASSSHSSARLEKAVSLTRVAGNCPHVPPAGIKLMFRLHLSKLSRAGEGFFKAGEKYFGRLTVDVNFLHFFPDWQRQTDNIFQSEQLVCPACVGPVRPETTKGHLSIFSGNSSDPPAWKRFCWLWGKGGRRGVVTRLDFRFL